MHLREKAWGGERRNGSVMLAMGVQSAVRHTTSVLSSPCPGPGHQHFRRQLIKSITQCWRKLHDAPRLHGSVSSGL